MRKGMREGGWGHGLGYCSGVVQGTQAGNEEATKGPKLVTTPFHLPQTDTIYLWGFSSLCSHLSPTTEPRDRRYQRAAWCPRAGKASPCGGQHSWPQTRPRTARQYPSRLSIQAGVGGPWPRKGRGRASIHSPPLHVGWSLCLPVSSYVTLDVASVSLSQSLTGSMMIAICYSMWHAGVQWSHRGSDGHSLWVLHRSPSWAWLTRSS